MSNPHASAEGKPRPHPNPKTRPKTQGQLLLEITAITGEYPANNIHRIIPARTYAKKVITTLIGDRMLKLVNKGGLKGYRLDYMGKRKLLEANPDRFCGYLDGETETNRLRTSISRRMRLHSLAEVCTMMHNAKVEIFQDVKPRVYLPPTPSAALSQSQGEQLGGITTPYFYTSREQKGQDDNAIRASRAAGTLLTPTHVYAVYNTGNAESQWRDKVELRYMVEIRDDICRRRFLHQYNGAAVGGIMMGDGLEVLEGYLQPKAKQQSGLHFLTTTYQPFYFITNDNHGEAQLRLLCDDRKMASLQNALTAGRLPPDPKYPIEHDALTKDGKPVLFCCLLDIPRLFRFRAGIALHGKRGVVIAFDFQIETLKRYLGDDVEFIGLIFDKFVGKFFADESSKGG